jgi:hypothetical protein
MGFFFVALALLLHLIPGVVDPSRAQSSRKDDIVFNSRGVPLAGATIRVCTMPESGQPCSPLAQIYSDSALTQALSNPTTTDGLGNYFGSGGCVGPPEFTGTSFTDISSFTGCGTNPKVNSAASSFIASTGLSTYQLRLNGGRSPVLRDLVQWPLRAARSFGDTCPRWMPTATLWIVAFRPRMCRRQPGQRTEFAMDGPDRNSAGHRRRSRWKHCFAKLCRLHRRRISK